jgi:hypothetical protein
MNNNNNNNNNNKKEHVAFTGDAVQLQPPATAHYVKIN